MLQQLLLFSFTIITINGKTSCGTNRWCYDIDVTSTSTEVLFQNGDDSAQTTFVVSFTTKGGECTNPTISFEYEIIDYSYYAEYIDLFDNDHTKIIRCGDSGQSKCPQFDQCLSAHSLGITTIAKDTTYQITAVESAAVDDLCNGHSLSINAKLKLECSEFITCVVSGIPHPCFDYPSSNVCDSENTAINGYYHPSCTSHCNYIQCDAHGGIFEKDCASGLVWDQSITNCNWPPVVGMLTNLGNTGSVNENECFNIHTNNPCTPVTKMNDQQKDTYNDKHKDKDIFDNDNQSFDDWFYSSTFDPISTLMETIDDDRKYDSKHIEKSKDKYIAATGTDHFPSCNCCHFIQCEGSIAHDKECATGTRWNAETNSQVHNMGECTDDGCTFSDNYIPPDDAKSIGVLSDLSENIKYKNNNNYYYGYIMLIGVIAFILINNMFIGCWCLGKGKNKQYENVKFDMVGDDEEI